MRRILVALLALVLPVAAHALSSSSIPTKVPTYWAQSASGSFSTCPIPTPSQIPITPGRASWTDGFPPVTFLQSAAGGVPPFGADFNGVLCQISQWTRWFNAGGSIPYDATFQSSIGGYPKGAIVPSVTTFGLYWISTVENNTSNPDTGGAGWTPYGLPGVGTLSGASTTFNSTQCGKQISRSNGNAAMIDTLPGTSPGILPANCSITIMNNDASAMEAIGVGAGAAMKNIGNFASAGFVLLGPGQSISFNSDGSSNYYPVYRPERAVLGANTTFFISSTGSNTSVAGITSATAFQTLQFANTYLQSILDLHGYTVTLQIVDSASPYAGLLAAGPYVGQSAVESVQILGNQTTPANVVINTPIGTSGSVIDTKAGARFALNGVLLQSTIATTLIRAAEHSTIKLNGNVSVANSAGGSLIAGTLEGILQLAGNLNITSSAQTALNGARLGMIEVPGDATATITLVGTPNFSSAFAVAELMGNWNIQGGLSFLGTGATGVRCTVGGNSVMFTGSSGNPNFFPGSVACGINTGGIYD